jgi:excisionase family DNA binding protein
LADLVERGYFARWPGLGERAVLVASECREVATSGQPGARGDAVGDDVLVTYQQAAKLTNMSVRTVRRHVAEGSLPCVRVGRLVRIRRADLEKLGAA